MNSSTKKPGASGAPEDFPILTDRLGFPPLEFDTTVPMIDSTIGDFDEPSLNLPTVQPIDHGGDDAETPLPEINAPVQARAPAPPAPPPPPPAAPRAPAAAAPAAVVARTAPVPPRSAPLPTIPATTAAPPAAAPAARMYGGATVAPAVPTTAPTAAAAPSAPRAFPAPAPAPAPTARPAVAAPAAPAPAAAPPVAPAMPVGPSAADLALRAQIESELRTAVLRGLAERLPHEIQAAVQAQMAPAIERLIEGLAAEARRAAAASVRDIVDRTLRAELERLRPPTRGST